MVESIIPMTAGLLLDICGTFLILRPYMDFNKGRSIEEYQGFSHLVKHAGQNNWAFFLDELAGKLSRQITRNVDDRIRHAEAVKWGFIFLSVGFFLILIASWVDYFEIL